MARIEGTSGDDTLEGTIFGDNINGAGGDDVIRPGGGDDRTFTQSGNDRVTDEGGDDVINTKEGDDTLFGGDGDDTLIGGDLRDDPRITDRDYIDGGAGSDSMKGGNGDDTIVATFGDTVEGGSGFDEVRLGDSYIRVDLNADTVSNLRGDQILIRISEIEHVTATGRFGNVTIIGDEQNNRFFGTPGDDVLDGRGGGDTLDGNGGVDGVVYLSSNAGVTIALANGTGVATGSGGHAAGDRLSEIENIDGSRFGDRLTGNSSNNVLKGDRGEDTLSGAAGADTLDGGLGDDTIDGGTGADSLIGGGGRDTLGHANVVTRVTVDLSTGRADGGDGALDRISGFEDVEGGLGDNLLVGDGLDNRLTGFNGSDTLRGGVGNDTLVAGGQSDLIDGGADDDLIVVLGDIAGAGHVDTIDGGLGEDTVSYSGASEAVSINLNTAKGLSGQARGDTYVSVETFFATSSGDAFFGSSRSADAVTLFGLGGDDVLFGDRSAERFIGGEGLDTVDYTVSTAGVTVDLIEGGLGGAAQGDSFDGVERVVGTSFADTLRGTDGDDILIGKSGDAADDLDGRAGFDRTQYFGALDTVVDLTNAAQNSGLALNDRLTSIEHVVTGTGADSIVGSAAAERFEGRDGVDTLIGGAGGDTLDGGGGSDLVDYRGSVSTVARGVTANFETGLGSGRDAAGDVFIDVERALGSDFDDLLVGDGDDNVFGGGRGADSIKGGDGADTMRGGLDRDQLTGGADADVFVFASAAEAGVGAGRRDIIRDFETGLDRIDLSRIDADPLAVGDQGFALVGRFSGAAGEIVVARGPFSIVSGDIDGDRVADFEIQLTGDHALAEADFLL